MFTLEVIRGSHSKILKYLLSQFQAQTIIINQSYITMEHYMECVLSLH